MQFLLNVLSSVIKNDNVLWLNQLQQAFCDNQSVWIESSHAVGKGPFPGHAGY